MTSIQKFFLRYSIFVLLVAAALYYWNYSQPTEKVHPLSWGIFGFFVIVFAIIQVFLLNAEQKKPGVLIKRFMGVSTFRLLGFLMIIVLYAMTHKTLAALFIWHFLVFYFLFVVFEIATLYSHFRRKDL